jgi:hypothetical protein
MSADVVVNVATLVEGTYVNGSVGVSATPPAGVTVKLLAVILEAVKGKLKVAVMLFPLLATPVVLVVAN